MCACMLYVCVSVSMRMYMPVYVHLCVTECVHLFYTKIFDKTLVYRIYKN